jgi:hypothetical protein
MLSVDPLRPDTVCLVRRERVALRYTYTLPRLYRRYAPPDGTPPANAFLRFPLPTPRRRFALPDSTLVFHHSVPCKKGAERLSPVWRLR